MMALNRTVPLAPVSALASTVQDLASKGTVLPKLAVRPGAPRPHLERDERPRYREKTRLGAGGLGEVTLALDEDIGRHVAIKRMHATSAEDAVMRFVDEVQVMGKLDHPNIVPVHDVGCDAQGRLYFVMKRLAGDTLEAIIERLRDGDPETHARFPLSVRFEIMQSILRALQFAHSKRIIHRDLKPSNIMLGQYGEVTVVDWGIAKRIGDPVSEALDATMLPDEEERTSARPFRTRVGSLLGTPAYMSPEQARGDNQTLDERSDIFSISIVFYELLTLRHPFEGKNTLNALLEAIRTEDPVPMVAYTSATNRISAELTNFVHRGLAKQREDRYASVGEMIESLHDVVDGTFAASCPVTLAKLTVLRIARFIDAHPAATAKAVTAFALACALVPVAILGMLGWLVLR